MAKTIIDLDEDYLAAAQQVLHTATKRTPSAWLATHDEDWRRALDAQAALSRGGRVRAVGFPDLMIAAVAERERIMLLHYDSDYDLIAEITGQPMQWVVPHGTVQ